LSAVGLKLEEAFMHTRSLFAALSLAGAVAAEARADVLGDWTDVALAAMVKARQPPFVEDSMTAR